jgi:hypothetical protein
VFRVVRGIAILAVVGYGVLLYSAYKAAEAIPAEVVLKVQSSTNRFIPPYKSNLCACCALSSTSRGPSLTCRRHRNCFQC